MTGCLYNVEGKFSAHRQVVAFGTTVCFYMCFDR